MLDVVYIPKFDYIAMVSRDLCITFWDVLEFEKRQVNHFKFYSFLTIIV